MNKSLTIIIPSYRSKKLVIPHIIKFYKKFKIIVIENSNDESLKKILKKKFKNVDIYLKNNVGFGRAVNLASKKVKTKFFFIINPDTKIYRNTLRNLLNAAKKIDEFGAIGPVYVNQKKKYKKNAILETRKIIAAAMLVNTKIFKNIKGFDENFFLYYEDDDFFEKCNSLNLKLYHITNAFITHKKTKTIRETLNVHSTTFQNYEERNSTLAVGGWHGQWSKFYFFKKHKGYLTALLKCLPNIILNLVQMLPYLFFKPSKAKYKYFKIEGFICSLLGMSSFKRSLYDIKNIY